MMANAAQFAAHLAARLYHNVPPLTSVCTIPFSAFPEDVIYKSSQIGYLSTSLVVALGASRPLRDISSESRTSLVVWKVIRSHGRGRFEIEGRHFQRISESNAFLGLVSGQSRLIAAEVLTPPVMSERDHCCDIHRHEG